MTGVRRSVGGGIAVVLSACLLLVPVGSAAGKEAAANVDLIGVWHVLVHYTDTESSHPDQLRWHDRLWVFARDRGKLIWSEYPIVVFGDEEGRFEHLGTNRAKRVLGGWQPGAKQLENIRIGLMTNDRGMKLKKLRGSDVKGWSTTSRARAASTSSITYQEIWSVEYADGLPSFSQEDVMGSARAESLTGLTRYAVGGRESGDVLVGAYERDGTRFGKFWMRRAGDRLRLDEKDPSERELSQAPRSPRG